MIEVEIKAKIANKAKMMEKLEEQKAIKINTVKQTDYIYLKREVIGFEITEGDPVIRIRKENDRIFFTLKKKAKDNISNIELETIVDDEKVWSQILVEMGYKEVVCVKKHRTNYIVEDITVCMDEVEKLGDFIEIEQMVEQEELEQEARKKIEELCSILEIKKEEIENKKYDVLVYEKNQKRTKS